MSKRIIFILIFISSLSFSQGTWHFTSGIGIGFITKDVHLWKYEVENKFSTGFFIGAGYEYSINENFSIRTKFQFHQYYAKVTVNHIDVKGYNYNFELPLDIRYTFYKYWTASAGVSFQDYRELDDFELERSNNIRTNLILDIAYQFNNNFVVNIGYSTMLSKYIDSFVVLHYTHHFYIGVTYLLGHRTKILKKL